MSSLRDSLLGKRSFMPARLSNGAYVLRVQSRAGILNPFSWLPTRPTYLGRDGTIACDEMIALPKDNRAWPTVPTSEVLDNPANYQFDCVAEAQQHLADRAAR
jgi:hypothetical protein